DNLNKRQMKRYPTLKNFENPPTATHCRLGIHRTITTCPTVKELLFQPSVKDNSFFRETSGCVENFFSRILIYSI
ncbi:MAG TPA: hypothetical protein DEH02_01580, partial [Bacteroidales bacterium]|nr:hypothetical protein [Bacteroidales bacterium]